MLRKRRRNSSCRLGDRIKNCFSRGQCNDPVAPLSKRGRATGRVKVCRVTGDRKICARMASLGVYPGVEADIICAETGHQCILKVNGGTLSIDSDISDNIFVTNL
ncbi:MAG: FeoA family protein [Desulforhopalus sp.]